MAGSADPAAACLANAALALNVLFGDADEALRCAREAVRIAEGRGRLLHSLSRLIMVVVTRGEMGLPVYAPFLAQATELADRSGDLALRFQIRSNQGVYFLDSGDTDRAERAFESAGALLSGADASILRISHFCNMGELELVRRDFSQAWNWFQEAHGVLGPGIPAFYEKLVAAGLGLCALEMGAFAEARARETQVDLNNGFLYYDPFIILLFRSRLHERQGSISKAISTLEEKRLLLKQRFPLAWLRLELRRAALASRGGQEIDHAELTCAIAVAERLGLSQLSRELDGFVTARRA